MGDLVCISKCDIVYFPREAYFLTANTGVGYVPSYHQAPQQEGD